MAAIVDHDGSLNLAKLADGLKKALPLYARPLFIRIVRKVDMTGEHELQFL
jgi:solute carrier family 27 fatty acid transporter 1/4